MPFELRKIPIFAIFIYFLHVISYWGGGGSINVSQTTPVLITFQQTFINHGFNLDAIQRSINYVITGIINIQIKLLLSFR